MSAAYLGEVFDIHGGGLDLIFPHHENEIAQSRCAHGTAVMANYWMHNGFLQVEGQKMSKSLGNFYSIHELLETDTFGGRKWPGEVLRLAMLMTHYREPIDFSVRRLEEAEAKLKSWKDFASERTTIPDYDSVRERFLELARDDLKLGEAFTYLDSVVGNKKPKESDRFAVSMLLSFLGLTEPENKFVEAFGGIEAVVNSLADRTRGNIGNIVESAVERPLLRGNLRPHAGTIAALYALRDWLDKFLPRTLPIDGAFAEEVERFNRRLAPREDVKEDMLRSKVQAKIEDRLASIGAKNWAEADRIRDELLAQGIQLKDGKDPATGERVTTWEVKR
jgi:cysteinyl-tRNA synthetase